MTLAVRIISLVMLVSLLGCASQNVQTSQPVTEKTQEEQSKKPAMPTITYRPGSFDLFFY
jgi:outer membrane lipoprotein SlyB